MRLVFKSSAISPSLKSSPNLKRAMFGIFIGLVAGYLISMVFGVLAATLAWFWLRLREKSKPHKQLQNQNTALTQELPDLVDLFIIALSSGLTIRLALEAIVKSMGSESIRTEGMGQILPNSQPVLGKILTSVRLGEPLAVALNTVPAALAPLMVPLSESERYGVDLLGVLNRVGDEARQANRRKAEMAARKVPVKLLFPLVVCILPAFGLLTLVPVFVKSLQTITQ